MGWNDHVDFEELELIEQAVDDGLLEEDAPAHGIALKVAYEGIDSLSAKQRHVYEKFVLPALNEAAAENHMNERLNMSMPD